MSQKSVKGSLELAKSIKLRRNELNLTVEEAASKAGVGTKPGVVTNLESL